MTKLPVELQEIAKINLKSIELTMKQAIAADMVETGMRTLRATFNSHENLKEFMALKPSEKIKSLNNEGASHWQDRDYEVYFSSMEVYEAILYLIRYQYPIDAQNPKITINNPVKYYYELVKKSGGRIPQPAGAPPSPGFVDFKNEIRLFDNYQKHSEEMGDIDMQKDKYVFGYEDGGLVGASEKVFKSPYLIDSAAKVAKLGGLEKLRLMEIKNAIDNSHYNEARDLILEVIGDKMDGLKEAKDPQRTIRINELIKEVDREKRTKLRAQHKLRLEAEAKRLGAINAADPLFVMYNTKPADFARLVDNLTQNEIEEEAIRKFYGELAEKAKSHMGSDFERHLLAELNDLNGLGWFNMSAENADFAASIAWTVGEIIIIEAATAGIGGFIAGAAGVARIGSAGSRTIRGSRAFSLQRTGWRAGSALRARTATTWLGRTRGATAVGRASSRVAGYVADGASWHSRVTQNVLHGGAFVEGQAMLHGHVVDPFSADGAMQIGSMALMFGVLGKTQQFLRGETAAARNVAGGSTRIIDRVRLGRLSNWLGRTGDRISRTGRLGTVAVGSTEIAAEVAGLHYFADAEQWGMIQLDHMTGGKAGMSTTEAEAMMETDPWKRWTHEAAVVLGLRTWRKVRQQGVIYDSTREPYGRDHEGYYRDREGYYRDAEGGRVRGGSGEPVRVPEPVRPPRMTEPPPTTTPIEGPRRTTVAYNPEIVAGTVRTSRHEGEARAGRARERVREAGRAETVRDSGAPILPVKIMIAGKLVKIKVKMKILHNGEKVTIKEAYEQVIAMPEGTARDVAKKSLDIMVAERMVLDRNRGALEYATRRQAREAKASIDAERHRGWKLEITETPRGTWQVSRKKKA